MHRALLLSLFFLGACAFGSGLRVPNHLDGVPWPRDEVGRAVVAARNQFDIGRENAALSEVTRLLSDHPLHVDAHRLRQDILRNRGRMGLLRAEAENRLAAWSDSAEAHYLLGRILPPGPGQARRFLQVIDRKPDSFWGWLGVAFSQRWRDPREAVATYHSLYQASDGHPLIAVAYAATLRELRLYEQALEIYEKLKEVAGYAARAELGKAETLLAMDREDESWLATVAALRDRPFDPGVQRLLGLRLSRGLSSAQMNQVIDVIWEKPERLRLMVSSGGARILAGILENSGRLHASLAALAKDGVPPAEATMRRRWRRMLLAAGDLQGFLADLRDSVPKFLIDDERNQLRGVWVRLLDTRWNVVADAEDLQAYLGLCESLLAVGMHYEADMVASMGMTRCAGDLQSLIELQDNLRRELAFEGAVRRLIYRGYVASNSPSLELIFEEIRRLSLEILGRDVVGEPEIFQVPFVGRMVNPFSAGLGAHFAAQNKHLVLGQRQSGPIEGLLLTRISLRNLAPGEMLPLSSPCIEVVGDNREIQVRNGILGGDLAGIALLNHYVIDFDSVRDWAAGLIEQRRVAAADGNPILTDPLPKDCDDLDPVDVHWRLPLLSTVPDEELLAAVFEMICWHERAHLVDSFHYLPPASNLLRVVGLMFTHGFDPVSIEAEMEARAEAAALAYSPYTRLVLAHIASFLENGEISTHGIGFSRLARQINEVLAAGPESQHAKASRWHRVDPERMRSIARGLLRSFW